MARAPTVPAVGIDSAIMHGTPVFPGTRVPVAALFGCLAAGESLDDFSEGYPTVTRDAALRVLAEAQLALLERYGAHPPR